MVSFLFHLLCIYTKIMHKIHLQSVSKKKKKKKEKKERKKRNIHVNVHKDVLP